MQTHSYTYTQVLVTLKWQKHVKLLSVTIRLTGVFQNCFTRKAQKMRWKAADLLILRKRKYLLQLQ